MVFSLFSLMHAETIDKFVFLVFRCVSYLFYTSSERLLLCFLFL